jgi:hypothetical protein
VETALAERLFSGEQGENAQADVGVGASFGTGPSEPSAEDSEGLPALNGAGGSDALNDGPRSGRLGIGAALLALGVLAPLAGFLVAETRRRRTRAQATRR